MAPDGGFDPLTWLVGRFELGVAQPLGERIGVEQGGFPQIGCVAQLYLWETTPVRERAGLALAATSLLDIAGAPPRWVVPHLMLQIRTQVLDGTFRDNFEQWYPGLVPGDSDRHADVAIAA